MIVLNIILDSFLRHLILIFNIQIIILLQVLDRDHPLELVLHDVWQHLAKQICLVNVARILVVLPFNFLVLLDLLLYR